MSKKNLIVLLSLLNVFIVLECGSVNSTAATSKDDKKTQTQTMQKEVLETSQTPLPFATHGLHIFLDDSEDEISEKAGAFSIELLIALQQKAGPILASASLLYNIFIRHGNLKQLAAQEKDQQKTYQAWSNYFDVINEQLPKLLDAEKVMHEKSIIDLKKFPAPDKPTGYSKLFAGFLESIIGFNQTEWNIYKVINNDHLILLIPKNYVPAFTLPKRYGNDPAAQALLTGFNYANLRISTDLFGFLQTVQPQKDRSYFIDALSKIFTPGSEYKKRGFSLETMPRWAIYLGGHGFMRKQVGLSIVQAQVANLSIAQFKIFLDFLEHQIVTRLLAYNTCYAAGTNLEKVYKNSAGGEYQAYSYAIALQGITETPSHLLPQIFFTGRELSQDMIDLKTKKLRLNIRYKFDEFFKRVTSSDTIDFEKTLELVFPKTNDLDLIGQLKLPGIEQFKIVDSDSIIVSIGNVLAKTRTTPLDILDFAKKRKKNANPKYILLYAPIIPFKLIINTPEMPQFVSMIPGPALHRLDSIESNRFTIFEMFAQFANRYQMKLDKNYIIVDLLAKSTLAQIKTDDTTVSKEVGHVRNVLILPSNRIQLSFENMSYSKGHENRLFISHNSKDLAALQHQFFKGINFENEQVNIQKIKEVQKKKAAEIDTKKQAVEKPKVAEQAILLPPK